MRDIVDSATCEHRVIDTWAFTDPDHGDYGNVAGWACHDCRRKFTPKVVTPSFSGVSSVNRRPLGECDGCGADRRHVNRCCPDCDCTLPVASQKTARHDFVHHEDCALSINHTGPCRLAPTCQTQVPGGVCGHGKTVHIGDVCWFGTRQFCPCRGYQIVLQPVQSEADR